MQPHHIKTQRMNPNPRATTVRLLTQWKDVQDSLTLMAPATTSS